MAKKTVRDGLRLDRTQAGQMARLDYLQENGGSQEEVDDARRTLNLVGWMRRALAMKSEDFAEFDLNGGNPVCGHYVSVYLLGRPKCCRVEVVAGDSSWGKNKVIVCRQNRLTQSGEAVPEGATGEKVRLALRKATQWLSKEDHEFWRGRLEGVLAALAMPYDPAAQIVVSKREQDLIERYLFRRGDVLKETLTVTRKSEREYDLLVRYRTTGGLAHGVWLPLACVRQMTPWTSRGVAEMTDHPLMAMAGDWSGVRDSSEASIWAILEKFVL